MLKHVLVKPLPFLFICTIKMINWLRKPNSIPKYRKGQRIRESKPAIGGVRSRDIRGNNKYKKGPTCFDTVRIGTVVSYAYPKPFYYRNKKWEQHKKSQWQYKVHWDGRQMPEREGVIQGRLKPIDPRKQNHD